MEKMKILLVEEAQQAPDGVGQELEDQGYDVTRAEGEEKGVELLKTDAFDFIITDFAAAKKDGFEIIKKAKHISPEITSFILTEKKGTDFIDSALRYGVDEYLMKSSEKDELLFRVKRAIEKGELKKRVKKAEEALLANEERLNLFLNAATDSFTIWDKELNLIEMKEATKRMFPLLREKERFSSLTEGENLEIYMYRATINALEEKIHVVDSDLRIMMLNQAFKEWRSDLGLETEIVGLPFFELFPILADEIRKEYRTVFKKGEILATEEITTVGDQEYITQTSKIPIFKGQRVDRVVTVVRDITEQKKAEEAVLQSKVEWERTFNAMSDWVALIDSETRQILRSNTAAEEFTGIPLKDLLGRDICETVHGSGGPISDCPFRKMLRSKRRETSELLFPEGERWCSITVDPIFDEEGKLLSAVHIVRDITARKRAEDKIREQNEFLNTIIESLNHPFYVINAQDYTIGLANSATGIVDHEKASTCYSLTHRQNKPCKAPEHLCPLEEMKRTKKALSVEHLHYHRDGPVIVEVHAHPVIDSKGEVSKVIEYCLNITERKNAQKALKSSEQEKKTILDNITEYVTFLDTDMKVKWTNRIAAERVDQKTEDLIGRYCYEVWYGRNEPCEVCPAVQVLATGQFQAAEIRSPDGTMTYARSNPVKNDNGEIVGVVDVKLDMTEQKRAEDALRESEERYRELAESITDTFFAMDKDLRYTYWNTASEELTGISEKEAIGKTLYELFPDVKGTAAEELYLQVLKTKKAKSIESRYHLGNQDYVFELTAYPTKAGCSVFSKDITKRRQTEEELRKSEARLKAAQRVGRVGDWGLDAETQGIFWSEQLYGLFERDPALGPPSFEETLEYFSPAYAEKLREQVRLAIEQGQEFDTDYLIILPSGKSGYRHIIIKVEKDQSGRVVKLHGTVQDITDRKRAEMELRRAHAASETALTGIITADLEGTITYANPAAARMWGVNEPLNMFGTSVFDYHPDRAQTKVNGIIQHLYEEGTYLEVEGLLCKRKDGLEFLAEVNSSLMTDEFENPVGMVSSYADITERERVEEELKLQAQMLENVSTGVYLVRARDGIIVYTNPRFSELFGYGPDEMIGKHVSLVNAPSDKSPEETAEEIMGFMEKNGYWKGEIKNVKKDGTPFWCYASVTYFDHIDHGRVLVSSHTDISDQKRSQERIQALARFPSENPNPVLRFSRDGTLLYSNEASSTLLSAWGYKEGKPLSEELRQLVQDALSSGMSQRKEIEAEAGDTVYSLTFAPVVDSDYVNVYALDISERKRTEAEREKLVYEMGERIKELNCMYRVAESIRKRERLEEIFQDVVTFIPPGWNYPEITRGKVRFGGKEYISAPFEETQWKQTSDIVAAGEVQGSVEVYYLEERPPLDEGSFLKEERDLINGISNALSEAIELKRSETALKESEGKYRAIFDSSNEAIFIFDADGSILETNNKASDIYGYSQKEFKNLSIEKLVHPDDKQIYFEHLVNLDTQSAFFSEYRNVRKDGSTIDIAVSSTTIYIKGKKYAVNIITDITERKRAEEELALRQQQLIQADKMASIGILSSGIAHEINNPNQIIRLYTPRLLGAWESIVPILEEYYEENGDFLIAGRKYSKIGEQIPSFLSKIIDGSNRIDRIVNDLKDFVRMDRGGIKTELDVNIVARSSVTLVTHQINKSTLNFSTQLGKKLPRINGNAQQLEQVLVNLVQNACDALTDRQQGIRKKTVYEAAKRRVKIDVQDEGEGIPPDKIAKITEPFFTMKKPGQGTGLGLSVSLNIIREHKGSLSFSSEPGKGTTATIHLPVP